MARLLTGLFWTLVVLYLVALLIWATGTFGWFGQQRDPLSGVYLIPLGLPWNRLAGGAPDAALPWIGALAPIINLAIVGWLARRVSRR